MTKDDIVVSTERLLELAYAAYRVNAGYKKTSQIISYATEDTEEVWQWSNKDLIRFSVGDGRSFKPRNFSPIEVTEEDLNAVALATKHFRRYTMLSLGDGLSDFQRGVFEAICKEETVNYKGLGFIAYAPVFVERELEDIAYNRRLKTEFKESVHVKTKEVSGVAEILRRFYLKDYDMYLYFAGMDGNLYNFTNKFQYENGTVFQMRGRVKGHDVERNSKVPLTRLNYVKLVHLDK